MLVEYINNPQANWKCKDTAIYLVTTLAAKAKTEKVGSCLWLDIIFCWAIDSICRLVSRVSAVYLSLCLR